MSRSSIARTRGQSVLEVPEEGAGAPTGNITVSDGTVNCVIALPATSCNLTPVSAGGKTLTATYAGDGNFNGSTSPGVAHTVNPPAAGPPILQSTASRKLHGGAGTFDLLLSPLPTSPTIEPRGNGAGGAHTVVFTFDKPVNGGNAAVTAGTATAGSPTFDGNAMTVPLSGVANAQYVTVTVSNVTATDGGTGGSGSVRIGILTADVNANRSVTLSDVMSVNAVLAQPVTVANYLRDVNTSGTLSLADILLFNSRLTQSLPMP